MTITVERIQLWRGEVDDEAGALAATISGSRDLQIIMGYSYPGAGKKKAVLEIYPGRPGASLSPKPTLLIQGGGRAGLREELYRAIADAAINMDFLVAQAVGDDFSVVVGFNTEEDAERVAKIAKAFGVRSPE